LTRNPLFDYGQGSQGRSIRPFRSNPKSYSWPIYSRNCRYHTPNGPSSEFPRSSGRRVRNLPSYRPEARGACLSNSTPMRESEVLHVPIFMLKSFFYVAYSLQHTANSVHSIFSKPLLWGALMEPVAAWQSSLMHVPIMSESICAGLLRSRKSEIHPALALCKGMNEGISQPLIDVLQSQLSFINLIQVCTYHCWLPRTRLIHWEALEVIPICLWYNICPSITCSLRQYIGAFSPQDTSVLMPCCRALRSSSTG
jgi:hypothetical protein